MNLRNLPIIRTILLRRAVKRRLLAIKRMTA